MNEIVDGVEKEFNTLIDTHTQLKKDYIDVIDKIPVDKPTTPIEDIEVNTAYIYNNWKKGITS